MEGSPEGPRICQKPTAEVIIRGKRHSAGLRAGAGLAANPGPCAQSTELPKEALAPQPPVCPVTTSSVTTVLITQRREGWLGNMVAVDDFPEKKVRTFLSDFFL